MKNIKYIIIFLGVLFINIVSVNASACSYAEQAQLNKGAANIKIKYEEAQAELDPEYYICSEEPCYEEYDYFIISILNLTEEYYLEVTNNVTKDREIISYSDVRNGIAQFDWEYLSEVTTFTIDVYSSSETNCPREKYRKIYLTTPRINKYYSSAACVDKDDYYLCQKYVTFNDISFYDFYETIEEYEKENENPKKSVDSQTFFDVILNFVLEHKTYFIIGTISALSIGVCIVYVVVKKRRKDLL